MKTEVTIEKMDHVIMLQESGLKLEDISKIIGLNTKTISRVITVYNAVRDEKPLPHYMLAYPMYVKWACEKLGKDYNMVMGTTASAEPKPEPKEDNTALAFATMLEAIKTLTEAVNAIDTRLSAMQMVLSGTRDEARQNSKSIVEAVNVNGDIQTKEWQAMKERLEAIKMNTRSLRRNNE